MKPAVHTVVLTAVMVGLLGSGAADAAPFSFAATDPATITVSCTGLGCADDEHPGFLYSIADPQGGSYPLFRFDLSSLSDHVATSDGMLTLVVDDIWPGNIITPTLSIFELNQAYDPTTVNFTNYGGHAATPLDTQTPTFIDFGDRAEGQVMAFMISQAVIQSWLDSPSTNYGLFLQMPSFVDIQGHSDIVFFANPHLEFEASPVPEPSSVLLLGTGGLGIFLARRRARRSR